MVFIVHRLFLSAEPAADPAYHIIPQGILESAIKITNEPPSGMWANLHKVIKLFYYKYYYNYCDSFKLKLKMT